MKLSIPGPRDFFASHQIANGVLAGTKITIHAFRETVSKNSWDPDRVAIFIEARNAFNEVEHKNIINAVVIHAPGIARYVHRVRGYKPWLVAGQHLIRSLRGTHEGDPLGMYLFSSFIQPMIKEIQADCALDLKIWCAEDGTLIMSR